MKKVALACFASLVWLATPVLAASDVLVIEATFGVFEATSPSELNFVASKVVPHRVDQRYGWVISLNTKKRHVSVREEYLLPSKPQTAEATAAGVIPAKRRNQISQRELVVFEGKIYGEWGIGPDEPAGHRHLLVFVENELAGDFEFDVK